MIKRHLLLLSSSNVHGYAFLEHSKEIIEKILKLNKVKNVLFIPFALKAHNEYTKKVNDVLSKWGFNVEGLHTKENQVEAIKKAEAIFIGGGNTFVLLKTLYDSNLVEPIRERILNDGIPYIGTSAGTNVATKSIETTNDMPIVYPPSFKGLGLVSFNINPHYLDPDLRGTHKGETRELRIEQFHEYNDTRVLGLREGTGLYVKDDTATLIGTFNARLFEKNKKPREFPPDSDLSFLLKN